MKRFACLLLTLGLLAGALAGCQQEETPSQSASTPAATPAPQETATPAPTPTAAPTAAPSKAPEATPAPAPEVGEELSMVEEEDGEFGLPGLTLGMSLEEVETAAALFPDAPQLELVEEREDRHFGVTIALYRLGATQLLDRQFAWELVFWDEQLHSISLTLEEGEDLAAFYQELEEGLADRFGLEDFSQVDLQSPLTLPSGAAYDQVNTSMAASDSGETTLTLTGLFQGDALVQLGLSLAADDNR